MSSRFTKQPTRQRKENQHSIPQTVTVKIIKAAQLKTTPSFVGTFCDLSFRRNKKNSSPCLTLSPLKLSRLHFCLPHYSPSIPAPHHTCFKNKEKKWGGKGCKMFLQGVFLLCFGNVCGSCWQEISLDFSLQQGMLGQGKSPQPCSFLFHCFSSLHRKKNMKWNPFVAELWVKMGMGFPWHIFMEVYSDCAV